MARPRRGRAADLQGRSTRAPPAGGRSAAQRGEGLHGGGRDPAARPPRRAGVGRRGARTHQFQGRGYPRLRYSALRSLAPVQLCRRGRRHRHADHARDPRRRSYLQYAQATGRLSRARLGDPDLWSRADDSRTRREKALQTAWRDGCRRLPTPRYSPRGDAQLSRVAWMESGRRSRDHEQRGAAKPLFARRDSQKAVRIRYDETRVDEWAIPDGKVRRRAAAAGGTRAGKAGSQWRYRGGAERHYRRENPLAHDARCPAAGGGAARPANPEARFARA